MAQILKQSTAIEVKVGPFLDDADAVTTMTALTISQADVQLAKNSGDFAQKNESTSLVHESNGWYRCLLDTTDTATLGMMVLQIAESGALPVWETFWIVTANVWDTLFGADNLDVSVIQWLGTAAATPTVAGVPEVDVTHVAGSTTDVSTIPASVAAILVDTSTTLDDLIDDLESRIGTPSNLGSGATIAANLVDIEGQTDDIGVAGAGLTVLATQASVNTIDDILDTEFPALVTAVADLPTNAELATALAAADDAVLAAVATVDTVVDAIKVSTDKLDDTVEDDGGTFRFTTNALEQAPTGGGAADGSGFTAIPWNAAWDAEVQSEVADALNVYDPPTHAELTTALAAADDAILAAIAALNNLSAAQVNSEVDTALADYDGPTNAEMVARTLAAAAYATAAAQVILQASIDDVPTNAELATSQAAADDATLAAIATVDTVVDAILVTTDKLDDTLEDDAGTFRFTENALEQAPAGGGGGGGNEWDELLVDHTDTGTFGAEVQGLAAMLGGQAVVLSTPVLDDLNIILVRGDGYYHVDGRALLWTDDASSWPSLVGGSVSFDIRHHRGTLSVAGTIVDADNVRVELSEAQTTSVIGDHHLYDLTATLASGHVVTLARGTVRVYDGI